MTAPMRPDVFDPPDDPSGCLGILVGLLLSLALILAVVAVFLVVR